MDPLDQQDPQDQQDPMHAFSDPVPPCASARMRRLPPYLFGKINAMKHKKRQAGIDIIDLGMGNPIDPTPQIIVDKLVEAARDPRNQRYSMSNGIYNLRREVARHYAAFWDVKLDPESEVIACIGSKEGFSHLCQALLGPGDTALVPTPAFPVHIWGSVIAGANVIGVPLLEGEEFLLEQIAQVARNLTPRPKVLMLCYPHNPTAKTVELDFFVEIMKLARRYDFYVINDFAYGLTTFDGYRAPSLLQVPRAAERSVELFTMSKAWNMAGWRVGFCVGNRDIVSVLGKIKGFYDYGIFQAIQIASIVALRDCRDEIENQSRIYQERRDLLCAGLDELGFSVERPRGTMFVWARMPEAFQDMGSIDFSLMLLEKAEIAVSPGRGFGEEGEGYLRIALVENTNRIRQALRQMRRALQSTPAPQAQAKQAAAKTGD